MNFISEFKQFISKGNVVDIAIGFIIGAAFSKVSASLVSDVLMPPLGLLISNVNFTDLMIELKAAELDTTGAIVTPAVGIFYGKLIQSIIDFFIIGFAVFLLFKLISKFKKKEPPVVETAPIKTDEVILLEQIRDLLKK